jgi:hypothetical protein
VFNDGQGFQLIALFLDDFQGAVFQRAILEPVEEVGVVGVFPDA